MLLIENGNYILDLGWYGNSRKGSFCIHFINGDWLTGCLLEKFWSRNQREIKVRIQEIVDAFDLNVFNDIEGYCIDDNDPNCKKDFSDFYQYEPRLNGLTKT